MDMGFYKIKIEGICQGVGFRPFLYKLADNFGFTGSIINKGNVGVELVVFAPNFESISKFESEIQSKKPSISFIESITSQELSKRELEKLDVQELKSVLKIMKSKGGIGPSVTSPPDIAICSDCINDMNNPADRRFFQYPFTACAVCGPRFTTIQELPYDRERTTMNEFPFCSSSKSSQTSCLQDYNTPKNRRFHAQTYSCKDCGPNYFFLYNPEFVSNPIKNEYSATKLQEILGNSSYISQHAIESIQIASKYILSGKIIAVMGIGGVHIVGDACNPKVIEVIRTRKRKRKTKPFAIMVKDIVSARKYVHISKKEETELLSYRRPIVLVPKRKGTLHESIAPGLHNIGIMLPYAGIHHLLFQLIGDAPLIFTSGNFSDLPMAISPSDVVEQLNQIADGYLLHNRVIYQRADDSVLRVQENLTKIIRRSRGYVPEYFPLPFETNIKGGIAVGPELSSTGLVARGYRLFPTQHIGNVDNLETYDFLKNAIIHMKSLLKLKNSDINFVSMDLHPQFQSTRLAKHFKEEMGIQNVFAIQHHFAHTASLMVDNNIDMNTPVIVSTLDGVGYGTDGNVWGGEVIKGTYNEMERIHHLSYIPMVGGDLCVTYPGRMVTGFLLKLFESQEAFENAKRLEIAQTLKGEMNELETLISSYTLGENVAYSSSCGRLIDAISNLLGVCKQKYYRGEPAMRLEGTAFGGDSLSYDFSTEVIHSMKQKVIPSEKIIHQIVELVLNKSLPTNQVQNVAASALYSVGKIFGTVSFNEAIKNDIHHIGLSGGVAYNDYVTKGFYETVENLSQKNCFPIKTLHHNRIPPGDAGISIGQAAIAISKIS
ncbi:MAG: carbamoyltransferase HypF [Promethearchaeota archaeon]